MVWKPLPVIVYGFAIHPLSSSSTATSDPNQRAPGRLSTVLETEHEDDANPYVVTLEVGDEVYAFEEYVEPVENGEERDIWYRGYVVCSPRHPLVTAAAAAADGVPVPPPTNVQAAMEEPQVFIGIFPASHIHVRDQLADAEGRLQEVFNRINAGLDPYFSRDRPMETLREEDEMPTPEIMDSRARKSIKLGPRPEQGNSLRAPVPVTQPVRPPSAMRSTSPLQKPAPPRPSLKSGDDTAAGATQPLIDEISSALREWHNLLFTYLSRRDYKLFQTVRDHVEELHLGRRQLLAQTLSADETVNLRRECVNRLVRGNVAQNLDVIVRHPAWGGLVTVDVEGDSDPRSWVGAIPMYAMQVALAYVDANRADVLSASRGSALGDIANSLVPRTTANASTTPTTAAFTPDFPQFPTSVSSNTGIPQSATTNEALHIGTPSGGHSSAKFFHVFLDLQAFVASPCSPGETAELYFSLYNKPDARFLTEEFCVILNHQGALARPPSSHSTGEPISAGGLGKIRTLFTDLGAHDIQESIYLVCRIVRNGSMKMSGISSSSGYPGGLHGSSMRRGSEAVLNTLSENEVLNGPLTAGVTGTPFTATFDGSNQFFRRPFGCAVLELTQLSKWTIDRSEATMAKEHTLPIFVPTREVTFSTLHQAIIASDTAEFEKSPRADMLAVTIKMFHGDAPTVIRENPSLLQDVPITSRLGFPDVVFPGDSRNEVYIKLWSGEFFSSTNTGSTTPRGLIGRVPSFAGALSGARNVQVSIEVRHRSGAVLENVISPGSGEAPMTVFHSMVFYRNNNPTFGELIKLLVPAEIMSQCHLFFTFRHRNSKEGRASLAPTTGGSKHGGESGGERPFAYAYLPLFPDGRAFIQDGPHTLVLYKAEKLPHIPPDLYYGAPAYVSPGMRPEAVPVPAHLAKGAIPTFDSLVIRSFLCSTKITQNPELLGLLNWEQLSDKNELRTILSKFTFVSEVEIVKFLRDIFDSLFSVLISKVNDTGDMDDLIFNALVTVLGIVQDRRFTNFQPVLDVYIDKHFTCAPAASKIIKSMNRLLAEPTGTATASPLRNSLKVWHYIFRFVIRARELQRIKEANVGSGATIEHFEQMFKKELTGHLSDVNKLMSTTRPESIIGAQTLAIQHFASILPDLAKVFTTVELVSVATHFSNSMPIPKGKLIIWKLIMYLQIVKGFLFENAQSRALLVESIVSWIKPYFGQYDEMLHVGQSDIETAKDAARISWLESTRLCITIVAVMLSQLQQGLVNPATLADRKLLRQEHDNVEYVLSLMPRLLDSYKEFQSPANAKALERTRSPATLVTVVPTVFPSSYPFSLISSLPPNPKSSSQATGIQVFNCGLGEAAIVLLALILSSPRKHLIGFLEGILEIEGQENFSSLLSKIFKVGFSILNNDAFPKSWLNVNILAHKVLLKITDPISVLLMKHFIPDQKEAYQFNSNLWREGFTLLLKLLSSDQLVIEEFSPQKRRAVWRLAGDIRGEGAGILLRLWDALGWPESVSQNAGAVTRYGGFQVALNSLVGNVLDLCLSHHDQLRNNAVHILYSMIVSEYHLSEHFNDIETELVNKLDALFMSDSKGDDISRAFFISQLRLLFESSNVEEQLRQRVSDFLDSVDLFLELLMNVRELPEGDEYQDDRVIATLRLMNFIRRIGRDEIYIKYVHQLVNMHLQSQNYVEAALTLKLHADLYEWDLNSFVPPMVDLDLPQQSHFVRKETLCLLILDYLGKGKAWESAIEVCKELAFQHSEVTFNYHRLSEILLHQATLLEHIVTDQRYYSEYFRVAFYGSFPVALRNKQFIYRGDVWEKYPAFCERMISKHPGAQLIKNSTEPSEEIRFGTVLYIQCTQVTPEPDRSLPIFTNPDVPAAVRTYYEHSAINVFSCTRPFTKEGVPDEKPHFKDIWTEKTYFTTEESFPTVLRRSEVIEIQVVEISPLDNALLDVEQKTKELQVLEVKFSALSKTATSINATALSMALNSVVDTPPESGVPVYRDSFLRPDYLARNPSQEPLLQKLRAAIDEQARVIDQCLKIHGALCAPEMISFHDTLMRFFRTNFHDEIQRLPVEENAEAETDINGKASGLLTRGQYERGGVGEWPEQSGRPSSTSITINGTSGPQVATTLVGQGSFTIPPLAFGQVPGAGIPAPPPTPGGSIFLTDPTRNTQTPLQRNLARLTRYGMSSITSGPGDRSNMPERHVTSDVDATSQQGSMINVGTGMALSSSRASVQATARDVASTISAAAKSRISRMGSFSWRRG
ncbi:hypothetical protein FRC14_003131 [Serendipita sp. 396]|nr:hypothetical protein FRC14_003131 [Serendipita sp. 396]KAG8788115.1 hypothetical protein FRC15_006079 [Serendipita sp. 397]KAG8803211.1 hypothetical protein FRC16_006682 [Serendipita sp. 398]KAG8824065.1 hypothetical protein FRC19_002640 [Serendipita sp. 401]KAG8833110.1 hypothetical protein FRC18_004111 [Serendipita sp. 400]KAG8851714.1 hypothetical protein FRB91_007442 [Serendipita sp. 411]KAG8874800.1 hypothetical protein FRC20_005228 [Serendipita sp. 405]KAG9055520.1 hypothetical prot